MNAKVTVDFVKKTYKIEGVIHDLVPSSTGDTSSMELIRNEPVPGLVHPDGRQMKLSLSLYVKNPKA